MKKGRKVSKGRNVTYGLLALAVALLLGSTVGSTRAALTYYSDNYVAEITVSQIGVSLMENGAVVMSRNYAGKDWSVQTNQDSSVNGALLQNMLGEGEKLALNKRYEERLSVRNSGVIDEYVRVRVYRYWTKENDTERITTLSPDLIELDFQNTGKWVKDSSAGEGPRECLELYYKGILPAGTETETFADAVRISGDLAKEVKIEQEGDIITTTYKYDGAVFHLDVEVDAVQTHNAQDAIRSAWGVDAEALGIL